jgi:hypothetical protein
VVALQVVERLDEEEEEEEVVVVVMAVVMAVVKWEVPIAEESASGYSARMRTWIEGKAMQLVVYGT